MRTETQKRIETYKNYLPGMKERVAGAGLMLIVAVIMIVSATFAWVTLSSKPEVSGINTTVTSNGSLEIALVHGDGTEFPTSGRGDSSAVDNDIARSNITWGNLVNLSDPAYGIQNIALRPALLNDNDLKQRPLYGATYGADGRILAPDKDYTFATWNGFEFEASNDKGVRAITAYKLMVSEATSASVKQAIDRAAQKVSNAINDVNVQYKNRTVTTQNMNALKGVLSAVISGKAADALNGTTGTASSIVISGDLVNIYNLYNQFYISMTDQTVAYTELANFQRYIDSLQTGSEYTELTWDAIVKNKAKYNIADPTKTSTDKVVMLPGLTQFISDYTQASKDLALLETMYVDSRDNGTEYTYADISSIVNRLTGVNTVTVNGKAMSSLGTSDYLNLLDGAQVQLTSGYLKNFEQFAPQTDSYRMNVTMTIPVDTSLITASGLTASLAKSMLSGGVKNANLTTSATGPSYTFTQFDKTQNSSVELVPGDKIATDNYGLAIDLWFRTNAEDSYLILDGKTDEEVRQVRAMGTDGNGAPVELYSANVTSEDGTAVTDVYKKDGKWYFNASDEEATGVTGTPKEKYSELTSVTGYAGSNRVWDEDDKPLITSDSTTQGNGSCYIFYADTPEDQERFIKLLGAFRVAFVSSDGTLLNTATLDTENYYAVNGKVTVPMIFTEPVSVTTISTSVDEEGNVVETEVKTPLVDENGQNIYAITSLEKNTATMITAIVYLDGTLLGNEDVLAASSIQGQLNFQFTSSEKMHPVSNAELEAQERTITASVDKTSLEYGEDELKVKITISVDGDSPANVSAFFQRAINSMQGKRMPSMTFQSEEEGVWTTEYTFTAPGEYYLREAMLDGVNYRLSEPVHVSITGFAPEYVGWGEPDRTAVVYTASTSYPEKVYISFGSDDSIVSTSSVRMIFMGDKGNSVNVKMSYNPLTMQWEGTANFGTSGVYTLQFVVVNGEYYDLGDYNANFVKVLTISLGLQAVITTSSAQRDFFEANTTYDKNMTVTLFDNSGNPLTDLKGAVLTYSRGSSSTDTVNAPLTWNSSREEYNGTLSIIRAGNYAFLDVTVGNNRITSARNAPTFFLRNPDPVSYNTNSVSNFHGDANVQFVPLTLDAYIGPIKINNSDTAFISAVVHNSITNQDYEITQTSDTAKRGAMYYDSGSWFINLPTYRDDIDDENVGELTQEGVWTVKSISLWDVIDENGQEHTISNKLVWTDGQDGYDFSNLSTNVSCSINIEMSLDGSTDLGDSSTPFMTSHKIAEETGMSITILDNQGRAIPGSKINDLSLNLSYTDNTDRSYGYIVSGYSRKPSIKFNTNDGAGNWSASSDLAVQYVGEYVVSDLTLTMFDNSTVKIDPGKNGVPAKISVRSAGPENNLKYTVKQGNNVIGKTGDAVTSLFLQKQNPNITVTARVTYFDEAGIERTAQFAKIDDLAVTLQLQYKDGKTAPNGGYSWTSSSLESIDLPLTAGENTSNGIPYSTPSLSMLAGKYGVTGYITVNGQLVPLNYSFNDLDVYSVSPTARFAGVSPSNSTEVQIFRPTTSNGNYTDYVWDSAKLVTVKNFFNANSANVYISCIEGDGYPDFTAPTLTIGISNLGSEFASAAISVPNAGENGGAQSFTFSPSSSNSTKSIGYVESVTETLAEGGTCGSDDKTTYEKPHFAGRQTIGAMTVTDTANNSYNVTLSNSITLNQGNEIPPSISFTKTTGYTMPAAVISEDGQAFQYTLPSIDSTVSKSVDEPVGDSQWTQSGTPTTAKYAYVASVTTLDPYKTSGCNPKSYCRASYDIRKYTRTTTVYTQTTGTNTYAVVEAVVGWIVDGVEHEIGDTITVSGQSNATPIIGTISKTLTGSSTKTGTRTVVKDNYDGQETKTYQSSSDSETQAAANTAWSSVKPNGYTWYTPSNPKDDGTWVHTEPDGYILEEKWN